MAEAILQKVVNDLYKRKFASCGNETAKGDPSYSVLLPNGHYREDRDRLSSEVPSDRAEGPRAQVAREVGCEEKTPMRAVQPWVRHQRGGGISVLEDIEHSTR